MSRDVFSQRPNCLKRMLFLPLHHLLRHPRRQADGGGCFAIPIDSSTLLHLEELHTLATVFSISRNLRAEMVDAYLSRHPPSSQLQPDSKKKTLVILGSGWGSTSLLKSLNTEGYHVIVVSPRNYFLFTRIALYLS